MLCKQLAYGLAVVAGLALTSRAGADDVIRLARPHPSGAVMNLGGTSADVFTTRYRGYYGGSRGYDGDSRPCHSDSYSRPFPYGGTNGDYRPYNGAGFYGYFNFYPPYDGCCGMSDLGRADMRATCARLARVLGLLDDNCARPSCPPPAPWVMPRADETYPYDWGPKNPVPMPMPSQDPEEDARPAVIPSRQLKGEALVSLKPKEEKKSGKWNYPAYGEEPTRGDR